MDDFRFAYRRLAAHPAACAASVVALACAIGAAAVAWSLISAALLHPLSVHDPETLTVVGQRIEMGPMSGLMSDGVLYPRFELIRRAAIFDATAANWSAPLTLDTDTGGSPTKITVGFVTSNFFPMLGVEVPLGRQFADADDVRGGELVAILADRYWRTAFHADPAVLGRTTRIAGKPVTIVGVLQHGFRGIHLGDQPDVFLPLQTIADVGSPFTNYLADPRHESSPTAGVGVVGRLRRGETRAEALAGIKALPTLTAREVDRLGLMPIDAAALPPLARRSLPQFTLLLASTVGLLLLIGCAAVGTLLLIRTESRREEFATCMALGASPWALARGVATEGLILAAAGGVLAIPVAAWLVDGIRSFQLPGRIDVSRLDLRIDTQSMLVCAAAALAVTSIVTLIACAAGFTANVAEALRTRSATRLTRRWPRTALVAGQTAFALVLVVGAGLFARSLIAALRLNPQLDASRLLTTYITLDADGRASPRDRAFFDELQQRLEHDPSVASVAFSVSRGSMLGRITVDGTPRQYSLPVTFDGVDQRYFRTFDVSVIDGRGFTAADRAGLPPVAIISESFARAISPGTSAVGHHVTMPWYEEGHPANVVEVVGVVPDVVDNINAIEPLAMYLPLAQITPGASREITVRAAGDVAAAKRAIVATLRSMDPLVLPRPPLTIEESIFKQMNAQRFGAVVLGGLGALALLLTALATYVVAESTTSARLRELSIRSALGATRRQLAALVLGDTGRVAGLGVLCGVGFAWLASGAIRALLFRVQPLDPIALGTAAGLILLVAALVSVRPALRAARVDVARLLRQE
jgi:predicted permease